MGHTNSTVNYNLPQFVGTDKPSWLGDVNGAFLAIDTAIAAAKTEADSAAGGVATLQNTVGSHTTQIGTLTDTVTAQGGTLNTVTALIGNGTPTTTDQTIIGAINEINAKVDAPVSLGSGTDLSGYTTTNKFTATKDGYLRIVTAVHAGNVATAVVHDPVSENSFTVTSLEDYVTIFIKKGLQLYVTTNTGNDNVIRFY